MTHYSPDINMWQQAPNTANQEKSGKLIQALVPVFFLGLHYAALID